MLKIYIKYMEIILIAVIITILVLAIKIYFISKNKRKLSSEQQKKYRRLVQKLFENSSISSKEKILEIDKIYHKILLDVSYMWTFWEILKQKPLVISDLNMIWELHKLRNKLAHEFDTLEESFLQKKFLQYYEHTFILLKKLEK